MTLRPLIAALLLAAVPAAGQDSGSAYTIGGIDVDVAAGNAADARRAAWRIAQRKAWPLLWNRMTGLAANSAPGLTDGQLDSIVAGIESQGEKFSTTRYIARLGVVFDRARSSAYLVGRGSALQSPPMLLLPVWNDGGARVLFQQKTPWRDAWQRQAEAVTPIDYVRLAGSAVDNLILSPWQTRRPDRASWRNIMARYDTVDVLVAEAAMTRAFPGGPVTGVFTARHGPDGVVLGRFALTATDAGTDAMLDEAVRRIDAIYAAALRDGRLRAEAGLTLDLSPEAVAVPDMGATLGVETGAEESAGIEIAVATPDAAAVEQVQALLRTTPGVGGVVVTSTSLGGASRLVVSYGGGFEALAYALDQRGWRLEQAEAQWQLRRRRPDEAPLPAPVPATPPAQPAAPPAAPPREGAAITAPPPPRAPRDLIPQ